MHYLKQRVDISNIDADRFILFIVRITSRENKPSLNRSHEWMMSLTLNLMISEKLYKISLYIIYLYFIYINYINYYNNLLIK